MHQTYGLQLVHKNQSLNTNVWKFVEPFEEEGQSRVTKETPPRVVISLAAPVSLDPLSAYMHFAQIRDTSGAKQVRYQKYYGNADRFMHSVNLRFGTDHSVGVLRGMLTSARNNRKKKLKPAMGVKIVGTEQLAKAENETLG
jgi:hypothetical protein